MTGSYDSSGLSHPAARWAFVCFLWLCSIANDILVRGSTESPLVALIVYCGGLVGALALTSRRPGPLPIWCAGVVVSTGAVCALYAVSGLERAAESVLLQFAVELVAFLLPRGNLVGACIGVPLVFAITIVWTISTSQSAAATVEMLGLPVVTVAIAVAWAVFVRWTVVREEAAHAESALAFAQVRAATAARTLYAEEMAAIRAQAEPLLAEISDGAIDLDAERRRHITIVEGDIRDRIRARDLRDPVLASAVAAARWRGARVVLLGDEETGASPIPRATAEALSRLLADPALRQATIRRQPQGRQGVVTIVCQQFGATTRHAFDERGEHV